MKILSPDLLLYGIMGHQMVDIEVQPTPSDATVTLSATGYVQTGNKITVPIGTKITYVVSKTGYYSSPEVSFVATCERKINNGTAIKVELSTQPRGTLNVTKVPSDSTLTLTATGYTQQGNSISVALGTTVTCTVSRNNMVSHTENVVVNSDPQDITLTCDCSVRVTPNVSGATVSITRNNVTQPNPAIVPYGSRINYTVSKDGYNTITAQNVEITQNTNIAVTLQRTMVTVSVTPKINNTATSLATVSLSTNASGVSPVSGQGTQQITVPKGSNVTYTIVCSGYNSIGPISLTSVQSNQNVSRDLTMSPIGITYITTDTSWMAPTDGDYRFAIITNGGKGGSLTTVKHIGGLGGGASGNTYIHDLENATGGHIFRFTFGSSNLVITRNNADYLTLPNGGNGASSTTSTLSFDGTAGGAATYGNGGGGGSGGAKRYTVVVPHYNPTTPGASTPRPTYTYYQYRGVINPGGDGGANANSGEAGSSGYLVDGGTVSNGGTGGTGTNASTYGGANNGGEYTGTQVESSIAGSAGKKGTGASSYQSTIESKIRSNALTSAYLRSIITAGGGSTGGVYCSNSDYSDTVSISTPGTGAGGGAWTNGSDGVDGTAGMTGNTFSAVSGGDGGHGVVIIWRPSDYNT